MIPNLDYCKMFALSASWCVYMRVYGPGRSLCSAQNLTANSKVRYLREHELHEAKRAPASRLGTCFQHAGTFPDLPTFQALGEI